ncbi:DNA cytosine methyltransferase [Polymorphobacter sp. PAMC 29334]|uniref:DNA cytosine methyltransferase n=1 Tax=Polymorphobacter sp. PAMC 29334 TaxID=2862331 RepID=UPI001C675F4F|nr:DNA cytosine methyltransferase [Polymorphobacter sp. PAMC 29334]QYE35234.1 DNA cytosine methyltransferase [Polymorphobacter sp. PAMC 29334]
MRPIGIDLFAGAGGMSLGFEQAGFDVVAAVEIDAVHAAAHSYNFPDCAVLARSVVGLSGDTIRKAAGIGKRKVDVVFGGAPCQGFSLIGQRVLDDPRNSLVREFVRIVVELNASYFVFENVKGLTLGRHKAFLEELIQLFEESGYDVQLPWKVLDAADYGVPQHRQRLFIMGAKAGKRLPVYPLAVTKPADRVGATDLPVGPSSSDALGDLPDADKFDILSVTDEVVVPVWRAPSAYARMMRCLSNDAWHFGHVRNWNAVLMTSSARTVHTDISKRRFKAVLPGGVEPISRFYKLHPDGLSNTLRAGTDGTRGAFTSPRPIHYEFARCVTVREMARLHGFPDWFRFNETKWHGARQIGNAVPPPLARAVASEVVRAGRYTPVRPGAPINLGDTVLLRMDITSACAHFEVAAPRSVRDKKSGATKRTQRETEAWLQSRTVGID